MNVGIASNRPKKRPKTSGYLLAILRLLVRRRPLLHPLLQCKQLLRPERLVVDLRSRFNQVLQVRPRQKVAQVHKLAVILVLHVHHAPPVLPSANRLAVNDHTALGADHRKRNDVLRNDSVHRHCPRVPTYPDRLVQVHLFIVVVVSVERIHPDVVVDQLSPNLSLAQRRLIDDALVAYLLLERLSLLHGQAVRFGNHRNNIDNFAQLLHHNDINRTERMSGRTDKVEAAMDACILDVTVTHSRQLLAQIRAVLVLDILHNGVPAITHRQRTSRLKAFHTPVFVVHLVSITRSVDNVQAKLDTILNNHCSHHTSIQILNFFLKRHTMRGRLNLGSLSDRIVRFQTTLGVDQVRRKNSVDERRLSKTGLPCVLNVSWVVPRPTTPRRTNDDDIELETTLQELVLNLLGNGVKPDIGSSTNFFDCSGGHLERAKERKSGVQRKRNSRWMDTSRMWRQICLFTLPSGSVT